MTKAQPPVVSRDDEFEDSIVSLYSFETPADRERAKEAIAVARHRLASSGAVDRGALRRVLIDSRLNGTTAEIDATIDAILALSTSKAATPPITDEMLDAGLRTLRGSTHFDRGLIRDIVKDTLGAATSDEVVPERIAVIIDKIDLQAKCLEGYAEQDGHSGKAPASVYHWQAIHFRDIATELRKALAAAPTPPASDAGAIPAGMKPWAENRRPNDIDTSEPIMFSGGRIAVPDDYDHPPLWSQVIAYTPAATGAGESVEAMRERCAKVADKSARSHRRYANNARKLGLSENARHNDHVMALEAKRIASDIRALPLTNEAATPSDAAASPENADPLQLPDWWGEGKSTNTTEEEQSTGSANQGGQS